MSEEPFKNREILEMFEDVKKDLAGIITQTTKTNGRVTSLEKSMYMGMGALSVIMVFIVPILFWGVSLLVGLDAKIQLSVDKALTAYTTKHE